MKFKNFEKNYREDQNLTYNCQFHLVWCTKYRRGVLEDEIAIRLEQLIREHANKLDFVLLDLEITPDTVHLVADINPVVGIRRVIAQLKYHTAHALRDEFPSLKTRLPNLWTRAAFVSTTGDVDSTDVMRYLEEQKGV